MNIRNKTALVTGAGSGIGLEIARLLVEKGNKVIIAGRNEGKIKRAGKALGVRAYVCDLSKEEDIRALVKTVKNEHPELSVLVNNAGVAHLYKLGEDAGAFEKATNEFQVNYFAPVLLTELLLPVLRLQPESAIINITSNVTFHPIVILPTYSDSKAALHSHTVALRLGLAKQSAIKVFEVMPSLVDTDATKDMGGSQHGIPPGRVAEEVLAGVEQDQNEIYVGDTAEQRAAYLKDPVKAIAKFNEGL